MFDELLLKLRARDPLPPLLPQEIWDQQISAQIQNISNAELFGASTSNPQSQEMHRACRAGLLLWNDDLEASHRISQSIETSTGSFWHAVMHRREGDFSNSRYWWRKTGNHPAFDDIFAAAKTTLQIDENDDARQFLEQLRRTERWMPEQFVAYCEKAVSDGVSSLWLQRVQAMEIETLLKWCRARL